MRAHHLTGLFLAAFGVAHSDGAEPLVHTGMCDASAAIAVDRDHFVVANDEDNMLRVYRRDLENAGSVAKKKLSDFLSADDPHKESDIEGAAQIGDRIYWISSHGASKDGEARPNRRRFFATKISKSTDQFEIIPVGTPFTHLIKHLSKHEDFRERIDLKDAADKAPESSGGLNIEGLAATPEGHLLIGLRNPLLDGKAILVPLKNPKKVIDDEADPEFGSIILLDLSQRGIRSIEYFPERQTYLLLAGSPGSGGQFDLYDWSGAPQEAPILLNHSNWGDFHPESLFAMNGTIYVNSDDGDRQMNAQACKDLVEEQQSFRRMAIEISNSR